MTELDRYFIFKCQKGLEERNLTGNSVYQDRLEYEQGVILEMGFSGYFLIVQDFINWAKNNDILVGPGRGSAAGSLVSYCLGITNLDPIKWNLLFERFLTFSRVSMPDIDVDIETRYRDEVIEYVTKKYGHEHVAHIGTFNFMRAKAAVKSMARTLGHPYAIGDQLSKMLLDPIHGKSLPLEESIQRVQALKKYFNSSSTHGEVLKWALKIENSISSVGTHASGIVISNSPLVEKVPLCKGKNEEIVTQWEMNNIEDIGLIKFDFLGLDALNKIHRCIDLIHENHGVKVDIDKIDFKDSKVFSNLAAGDYVSLFQLEGSTGMRDLMVQVKPKIMEDIAAIVAIFRPGPLASPYKDIYLQVRAGLKEPEYLIPELEPILKTTGGWLIYQEQCMEIAKKLCGYPPGQADDLRKAIGKKIQSKMDKHEPMFKEGWKANGFSEEKGDILWDQMVAFAAYGFNKSHAAAYAVITYQTAWLKTYYPLEYMTAVLISESERGDRDKIIQVLSECKRLNIDILPPDINTSKATYSIEKNNIRFGLGPIKNLGISADEILKERIENGIFKSFPEFCDRINLSIVNRKKIDSLIRAGAFDSFGFNRASLLSAADSVWEYKKLHKAYLSKMQTYEKRFLLYKERQKLIDEGSKKKPLKTPIEPEAPIFPEVPMVNPLLKNEIHKDEHQLLGFFVSSHPLDDITPQRNCHIPIDMMKKLPEGTTISFAAVITSIKEITTKAKKEKMAYATAEDLSGTIEITLFPQIYAKASKYLEEIKPLRIDGVIDVIETDEKRIVKVKATKVSPIHVRMEKQPKVIDSVVRVKDANKVVEILNKYKGNLHKVRLMLRLEDGTLLITKKMFKIGDFISEFTQELSKLWAKNG